MPQQNDTFDPRLDITHEIVDGQVYRDTRTDDELRLVYDDDNIAVLRYRTEDNGPKHRLETRADFEANVGSGRFDLTEPGTTSPRMPDDVETIRALVKRLRDHYAGLGTRTGKHKAQAMAEFYDELNELAAEDVEPMDFEEISGIGAGAAENLREHGFVTEMDVARADKETIMDVPLMGQANTENLLEAIDD